MLQINGSRVRVGTYKYELTRFVCLTPPTDKKQQKNYYSSIHK